MEQLREIPKKIIEWWNKFSSKQKTVIISIAAGVVLALVLLVTLMTRKVYVPLVTCETAAEGAEVVNLLESNGMTYKTNTEGTVVSILESQEGEANLLLGANNITTMKYTIDQVTEGGFSTTESDKQKRYVVYKQEEMVSDLEENTAVKKAWVKLDIQEDDGTLIAQDKESFAAITLELEGELTEDGAAALARFAATALGNETTDNITIIDTEGNLLFSGADSSTENGLTANSQLSMKKKAEDLVRSEVKAVLLGTDLYDNIEVASNLDLDFSTVKETNHDFTPAENSTQGVLSSEDLYQSDAQGVVGGVPGTYSNDSDDGTTYDISNMGNSSESVTQESRNYLPNEFLRERTIPAGLVQYDTSSISVTAKTLRVYKEEDVKAQGLLTDMSWEEFKAANESNIKLEVDEDIYAVVHTATGIPTENISIVAYEVPIFVDKEGLDVEATDVIQIVIILIILGLLGFVILLSMRGTKSENAAEELSVESLLQSTPAEVLEDIELDEKSETRKMIEKFVDENPEAVANLLRNWLSEDWG
ncbi:MAG: flagellar M-ring protein FliF [Lachnospiraceae bacterium]|nr:flagellar M-ring protein FliF [Lachnospiraceae bacterium]